MFESGHKLVASVTKIYEMRKRPRLYNCEIQEKRGKGRWDR